MASTTITASLEPAEVTDAFEAFLGYYSGATATFMDGAWVVWEPETGTYYTVHYRMGRFTFKGAR